MKFHQPCNKQSWNYIACGLTEGSCLLAAFIATIFGLRNAKNEFLCCLCGMLGSWCGTQQCNQTDHDCLGPIFPIVIVRNIVLSQVIWIFDQYTDCSLWLKWLKIGSDMQTAPLCACYHNIHIKLKATLQNCRLALQCHQTLVEGTRASGYSPGSADHSRNILDKQGK